MGIFEYIGVLISVIMGLGITHLATGTGKLIQHRDEVRFYLPHSLWTANILILILLIWWGMFAWSGHEQWYAYQYLFITLYAIVSFFLASMLYPWDMARDINVREHFFKSRYWFFGALLLAWGIDLIDTLLKMNANLRPIPNGYFPFITVQLCIAITGLLSRRAIVHVVLPFLFMALVVVLIVFSEAARIDG